MTVTKAKSVDTHGEPYTKGSLKRRTDQFESPTKPTAQK